MSIFDGFDPLGGATRTPAWSSWATQLSSPVAAIDQSAYPSDLFAYGAPIPKSYSSYDPSYGGYTADVSYAPLSVQYGHGLITQGISDYIARTHPEYSSGFSQFGTGSNSGVVGNPADPKWAKVNAWNPDVLSAVQQVQQATGVYVPPNVVKAFMMIESQGDPNSGPAAGLLQVTSGAMGSYDLAKARSDPAYGLWAGVNDLALRWKDAQSIDPSYTWSNVASGYFSGHYVPNGAKDSLGTTDQSYVDQFNANMAELGQSGSTGVGGTTAATGTKSFNAIWGGFNAPITQEFGHTEFADTSSYAEQAYQYTSAYSRDGKVIGHAGVDVGVSYGTQLFSPLEGQVTLAGGTGYYCDADGNGCGPHVGELALTLTNGDVLILGHMSQIKVNVGDTVQPGQFVGFSGSENGAHVHVEYRKYWGGPGTVTSSGYEAVDPRQALQGVFTGTYGATAGASGPEIAANPGTSWADFMRAGATGKLIGTGMVPAQGGFHDWLYAHMPGHQASSNDTSNAGWVWSDGSVHPNPQNTANDTQNKTG
jgi:murein DD-endopeptidase MepM/ murein hydrolase activator NlpD